MNTDFQFLRMDSETQTSKSKNGENESDPCVSREEFSEVCRRLYRPCQTKTLMKDRFDQTVRYLKGLEPPGKGSWRYRVEKKGYTLVNFPSLGLKDVLCVKGTEADGVVHHGLYKQWRRVVPVEEFYDVLMETHVKVQKHGGYKNLLKAVKRNYAGIPREAAVKFVGLCTVCRRNPAQFSRTSRAIEAKRGRAVKTPCTTSSFNYRTQVEVVKMSSPSDEGYSHLGMYMDHWTSLVTLFPMMGSSPQHVAYGLASSVFPYFGPPTFLHCPEGKDFANQVIQLSMLSWRGGGLMQLPEGRPGLEQLGRVMEETRGEVLARVDLRAEDENLYPPLPWAKWLGKIMFDINNEENKDTGLSPYSLVFETSLTSPDAAQARKPVRDLAYTDLRQDRKTATQPAPPPPVPVQQAPPTSLSTQLQAVGGHSGLTFFIDAGAMEGQPFFLQQTPLMLGTTEVSSAPVFLQTDMAKAQAPEATQVLLAEEADAVLPVAATEVLSQEEEQAGCEPQPQTFTSSYVDSGGRLHNFVINVEPGE